MPNDFSNPRTVRKAEKAQRQAEAEADTVVATLMGSPAGRRYVHSILNSCSIFGTTYSPSSMAMAFAEGQRNIGLSILADVMRAAPDQYIQMMREENDRHRASDRPSRDRQSANGGNPESFDSGPTSPTDAGDYDPTIEDSPEPE